MNKLSSVQIITQDDAHRLVSSWPADVSFSAKFARIHTLRHGFKGGFVLATYSADNKLLFPIQWGRGSAFSVHKGHTTPYVIGTGVTDPEWPQLATEVRKLTNSNLYIADLAVSGSMAHGLKPLPSAVFILDLSRHDINFLFTTFNKTTRNLIRRAQDQNYRMEITYGKMPENYYELYACHQRSMGTPPRLKEYFDEVAGVFGEGFVLIGAYDQDKLAGLNLSWCADRGLWLSINSSMPEYSPKHVNYMLYYETIRWACEHGIDRVDLGGSPTHHGNAHNAFKLGFGAKMTQLYRLTSGTFRARLEDKFSRKKRALRIRFNKLWKN